MGAVLELVGIRFGRLVLSTKTSREGFKDRGSRWICRCDCGGACTATARNLRSGHTQSCGCLHREVTSDVSTRHGDNRKGGRTAEYRAWSHIRNRCENPRNRKFADYGGRGIRVCDRWQVFEDFLADMGR